MRFPLVFELTNTHLTYFLILYIESLLPLLNSKIFIKSMNSILMFNFITLYTSLHPHLKYQIDLKEIEYIHTLL